MQSIDVNGATPQSKIISVANKFGNTGIKNMQGTTVSIYDTLPLDGRNEYRFFEGSSQRNFPFSNTGADGNKLGVGSSMIINRAYIQFVFASNIDGVLNGYEPFFASTEFAVSEFSFEIANSQVIKQFSGLDFTVAFNKSANTSLLNVIEFDTQINIQPLLEFVAILRVQRNVHLPAQYIRFTMEGTGAIIAPRTTF